MTDINIHNLNEISIKDLSHDLNISDAKWDSLINCFFKISEATYFYGIRKNYLNDELKRDIVFLSEEELFNEGEFDRILFRVKSANLIINRSLLSHVWDAYESPCLIFSRKASDQELIRNILFEQIYYPNLLKNVDGIFMVYQSFEYDVLWLLGNEDISSIPKRLY